MKWIIVVVIIFIVWRLLRSRKHALPVRAKRLAAESTAGRIKGPGKFSYDVRGEFAYQDAIRDVVDEDPSEDYERTAIATLVHEDDNKHDPMAIRVDIEGECVGYLSRDDARAYRKQLRDSGAAGATLTCDAKITTEYNDIDEEWRFEVWLDLPVDP